MQKNGYVHPMNGALKQKDNVSCSKSAHQGAEFRCPLPKSEETWTSSYSSSTGSDFTASIASTSLLASPRASHYGLPSATVAALQEKQADSEKLLGRDPISRVRLNGSYQNTSNVTLTAKQSAQGPETGIISEFFSHSRLHHISTWRNEFSEYVNTLQTRRRAAGGAVFPGKDKLKKLRSDHCAGIVINYSLDILFESDWYM